MEGARFSKIEGGFCDLPGPKNEDPPHLPPFLPEKQRTPRFYLLPTLPPSTTGHQLLSATLKSGSSDRYSTSNIDPKIEISPLLKLAKRRRNQAGQNGTSKDLFGLEYGKYLF